MKLSQFLNEHDDGEHGFWVAPNETWYEVRGYATGDNSHGQWIKQHKKITNKYIKDDIDAYSGIDALINKGWIRIVDEKYAGEVINFNVKDISYLDKIEKIIKDGYYDYWKAIIDINLPTRKYFELPISDIVEYGILWAIKHNNINEQYEGVEKEYEEKLKGIMNSLKISGIPKVRFYKSEHSDCPMQFDLKRNGNIILLDVYDCESEEPNMFWETIRDELKGLISESIISSTKMKGYSTENTQLNNYYVELIKNPNLSEVAPWVRGYVSDKGNLYIWNVNAIIHSDMRAFVTNKIRPEKIAFPVQRYEKTNRFYLSEGIDNFSSCMENINFEKIAKGIEKKSSFKLVEKSIARMPSFDEKYWLNYEKYSKNDYKYVIDESIEAMFDLGAYFPGLKLIDNKTKKKVKKLRKKMGL